MSLRSIFLPGIILMGVGCATISRDDSTALKIDPSMGEDFVNSVCPAKTGPEFKTAWLRHEEKYWEFYRPIYYGDPDLEKDRNRLVQEFEGRQIEFCKNARTFLVVAPSLLKVLAVKANDLMGARPDLPFFISAPLQWTDGRGDLYRDQHVYALNAWHDTFARTTGLAVTLLHELVHAAHSSRYPNQRQELSPFLLGLYREGAAVFAVQQVFPEVGDKATGLSDDQLKLAKLVAEKAAKEALTRADASTPDTKEINRFFRGGWKDATLPPKMGYFLGNEIFRRISRDSSPKAALQISPKEFAERARKKLAEIASE